MDKLAQTHLSKLLAENLTQHYKKDLHSYIKKKKQSGWDSRSLADKSLGGQIYQSHDLNSAVNSSQNVDDRFDGPVKQAPGCELDTPDYDASKFIQPAAAEIPSNQSLTELIPENQTPIFDSTIILDQLPSQQFSNESNSSDNRTTPSKTSVQNVDNLFTNGGLTTNNIGISSEPSRQSFFDNAHSQSMSDLQPVRTTSVYGKKVNRRRLVGSTVCLIASKNKLAGVNEVNLEDTDTLENAKKLVAIAESSGSIAQEVGRSSRRTRTEDTEVQIPADSNSFEDLENVNQDEEARVSFDSQTAGTDSQEIRPSTHHNRRVLNKHQHAHHAVVINNRDSYFNDIDPKLRFYKSVRRVICITKVCGMFRLYVAESQGQMTLHQMDMARKSDWEEKKVENYKEKILGNQNEKRESFDILDFKCYTEFKFPRRGREICDLNPVERTPYQVECLRRLMLTLEAFRTYPHAVQTLLCKRLRYERYERRRLIIRRGHVATSLYFIFSGSIGITKAGESAESVFTDSEPITLGKGALFGDIALINNQRRNASIVCMEHTEFLVCDREDFIALNLFDYHDKEYQGRLRFFENIPLLKNTGAQYIAQLAGSCKNEWSIHNQVVVKDSNNTNFVYFVKSGRLSVVRLLQLDSCFAFKNSIAEMGAFPKVHLLSSTLRQTASETKISVENQVKTMNIPDINCSAYMQVNQLQSGDFFGLNQLIYPDDRQFILISEGCELLKINLNTFKNNKIVMESLQNCVIPQPSDEELAKIFMAMNHWSNYSKKIVQQCINRQNLNRHSQVASKNRCEVGDENDGCISLPFIQENQNKYSSGDARLSKSKNHHSKNYNSKTYNSKTYISKNYNSKNYNTKNYNTNINTRSPQENYRINSAPSRLNGTKNKVTKAKFPNQNLPNKTKNCSIKRAPLKYFTTSSKDDAKGEYQKHIEKFRKSGNHKHYDETVGFERDSTGGAGADFQVKRVAAKLKERDPIYIEIRKLEGDIKNYNTNDTIKRIQNEVAESCINLEEKMDELELEAGGIDSQEALLNSKIRRAVDQKGRAMRKTDRSAKKQVKVDFGLPNIQTNTRNITRLIQGISLPTFKLQSFV